MQRQLGHSWAMDSTRECVIVGGDAAGLSVALVLGRTVEERWRSTPPVRAPRGTGRIGGVVGQTDDHPQFYALDGPAELANHASAIVRRLLLEPAA